MSTTNANISFYSHVLSGLARRRQAPSSDPARATIQVQSHIATSPGGASAHTIALDLTMYGPQDVTGLDSRHITREEPRGGAQESRARLRADHGQLHVPRFAIRASQRRVKAVHELIWLVPETPPLVRPTRPGSVSRSFFHRQM